MARAQNLQFRSMFMWKSKFQGFKFVGICKKASFFSILAQWNFSFQDLVFFGEKKNFLTRDILFEMKLSLSSAASSMLQEVNFK